MNQINEFLISLSHLMQSTITNLSKGKMVTHSEPEETIEFFPTKQKGPHLNQIAALVTNPGESNGDEKL